MNFARGLAVVLAVGAACFATLNPIHAWALDEFEKITAADAAPNDNFGYSISASGNVAILGAWKDDDGGDQAGSAYIFRNPGTGTWSQVDKLTASDAAAEDNFGASVGLSGNVAIVGAPFDGWDRGSAYLFRDNGANDWVQFDKLLADDGVVDDEFGYSVAVSGNTAIVGAIKDNGSIGAAYVFRDNGLGDWLQIDKLVPNDALAGAEFGNAVAISGNTALIGAHFDSGTGGGAGAVYVFQDNGTGDWSQVTKLLPTDPAVNKQFGASVAFSGHTAVIGAVGDGTAGVLSGAAYIFQRDGGLVWSQKDKLTASDGNLDDQFGYSVAFSGNTVVVGAYQDDDSGSDAGSAYLFRDNGLGNWNQIAKLRASDAEAGDVLGTAVAMTGNTALVGAPLAINDSGAGYMYTAPLGLAGDYNDNGQVDGTDYVVWRNMQNQAGAGLAADGNGDDIVNQLDYQLWRENFGIAALAGTVGFAAAIPEPGAMALLSLGLTFFPRRLRK